MSWLAGLEFWGWALQWLLSFYQATEDEEMELVPHITLNPSFNIDMLEYIDPSPEQEFPAGHDDTDNLMAVASSSDRRSSLQSQRKHERQKKFPNG